MWQIAIKSEQQLRLLQPLSNEAVAGILPLAD